MDLSSQRREYDHPPIADDAMLADPFGQFELWYQDAVRAQLLEPNAMVLSTVDPQGRPAQRTVLLKYFDRKGFMFFTNYASRKSIHIGSNAHVSILFQWLPLQRQIEINGKAERVPTTESLKYFATRPRGSQLGAWVSEQSQVITSRSLLEAKLAEMKAKFLNREVPLPSFWGGYNVVPERFEFWQGQPNRLHDRFEYRIETESDWTHSRLAP
ncbi:MAG: pyridoxamine 5'-phosphate oxidase [Pirellulales bacterium]